MAPTSTAARRLLAPVVLAVLALACAGAASATPPVAAPTPPSWLTGQAPVADPLQTGLEGSLQQWQDGGRQQALDDGCVEAYDAATAAFAADKELNVALSSMQDAYSALKQTQRAGLELILAQVAQAGAQAYAIVMTAGPLTATINGESVAMAPEIKVAALQLANMVSSLASLAGDIQSALYTGKYDVVSGLSNYANKVAGTISALDNPGSTLAGALGASVSEGIAHGLNVFLTLRGLLDSITTKWSDADASTQAYAAAAAHYNALLQRLESHVTTMKSALKDCPPKKEQPPKECYGGHNGGHVDSHSPCKAWWARTHPGQPFPTR